MPVCLKLTNAQWWRVLSAAGACVLLCIPLDAAASQLKDTAMKLTLQLQSKVLVFQESMQMTLRLENATVPITMPLGTSTLVTYTLRDARGIVVETADFDTRWMREGHQQPQLEPQEKMGTRIWAPGTSQEWQEDLASYLDIPAPGHYTVQASFKFRPSSLDLESASVAFNVLPSRIQWLHLERDSAAMSPMLFQQQYTEGGQVKTRYRIATPEDPMNSWIGGTLAVPAGMKARVSISDFVTSGMSWHDAARWVVWTDKQTVFLTQFEKKRAAGQILQYSLDFVPIAMSTPVQHKDGSVSVLLMRDDTLTGAGGVPLVPAQRYTFRKLNFDADGKFHRADIVAEFDERPQPLASTADEYGRLYVVAARAGRMPVQLITQTPQGAHTRNVILAESYFGAAPAATRTVLALRASGPLAVVQNAVADSLSVVLVKVPLEKNGHPAGSPFSVVIPFPTGLLAPKEQLQAADILEAPEGQLHGLVTTSMGRLFALSADKPPKLVATLLPEHIGQAGLVDSSSKVSAFYPTADRGIAHVVLESSELPHP